MPTHHHRAGSLKQTNKKNKRSKASKRSAARDAGGKVAGRTPAGVSAALQSRADRRHHQQQRRDAKRQELLRRKRGLDGAAGRPPRVVGIVSLSDTPGLEDRLRDEILRCSDHSVHTYGDAKDATVTCKFNALKKEGNVTLLTTNSFNHFGVDDDAAVLASLDLARACDILLFVLDGNNKVGNGTPFEICVDGASSMGTSKATGQNWDHLISKRGDRVLTAIKGQGLPTILTILAHTERDPFDGDEFTMMSVKSSQRASIKRHLELKKYVSRFALTEFGSGQDKVVEVDLSVKTVSRMDLDAEEDSGSSSSCASLVRSICQTSAAGPKFVSELPRSYLISDSVQFNEESAELSLSGYVRGLVPLDVNALFHVPNLGTFRCKSVQKRALPLSRNSTAPLDSDRSADVIVADSEQQESLEMFASPDALEGEQNLVGFDETMDASADAATKFARPAGWSTYQSAWLDAVDEDNFDDNVDTGEMAEALNQPKNSSNMSLGGDVMDLDDANDVTVGDKRAIQEQRRKEMKENIEFPDEVEVDEDVKASERFARYRSLKSFRKSHWDPKENLPDTYASIFHFSNFKATQRAIMNEMKERNKAAEISLGNFWGRSSQVTSEGNAMATDSDEEDEDLLAGCIPTGSYVTLTLSDIPVDRIQSLSRNALFCAVSLLPHENKVSVLHMGLSQSFSCDSTERNPIKSKDVLVFRCGWRTWKARPVFSQNNLNCDKHKFERYMPLHGAFFAASVFGPVTYTPCPILVFRETEAERELVAIGSMIGADADRIAIKRIVLTGFPVRVQKRWATVKYMFYNPDDVKWFKPAGLYTKHGLQGNIEDSVGEHGTMKCLFNAPIKQHDTVCLPLYKRVYPKFVTENDRDGSDIILSGKPTLKVL